MFSWVKKIFGTSHERAVRRMQPKVEAINALEDETEEALRRRAQGEDGRVQGEARQRRDARRHPGRGVRRVPRGGPARRSRCATTTCSSSAAWCSTTGCIAEMRTGEGKTLVATLACYLNALEGKGVHVVTVNDYLARRDAEWMGKLYGFLGLTTGVVVNQQDDDEKKRRLPGRHHLRPEQRVRLRLPARQHEVLARSTTRSARSTTRSSTRSTRSSSTRRARRSSSAARPSRRATSTARINEIIPQAAQGRALRRRREEPLGHAHRRRRRAARRS